MRSMQNIWKEHAGRKIFVLTLGAAVYALLFSLGSQIDQTGVTTAGTTLTRFAVAFPIAWGVLLMLMGELIPKITCAQGEEKKPFCTWGAFLVIFLCYVPIFLIYYPGTFAYDTQVQAEQVVYSRYTTFHPLVHTLFLGACLSLFETLESLEKCAAVYSLIQMALMAGCFALTCSSVSRSGSRRAARICTGIFALYPFHMIFASTCTKDVLFSGLLTVFLAWTLEWMRFRKLTALRFAGMVVSGMMACLLRNNMIYAMLVWMVILLIFGGKRLRRIACCAAAVSVLSLMVNQELVMATHAEKGNIREMLSVPIQQLSRAHRFAPQVFTQEEQQALDTYICDRGYELYDETLSDQVKWRFQTEEFKKDPVGAAKLWLSVGKKCPEIYLDAFLNLMLPYLYPYQVYRVTPEYIDSGSYGTVLTELYSQPPLVHPSRFKDIRNWLDTQIWADGADHFPILRWVFNAGLIIWLMLLSVFSAMYAGKWKRFIVLLLPVLLWGTYLLGPVAQSRYLYPFVCVLPLLFVIPKNEEVGENDV